MIPYVIERSGAGAGKLTDELPDRRPGADV